MQDPTHAPLDTDLEDDNQVTNTPASGTPAPEGDTITTTSNLINPETLGSTAGEGPYVPLDTSLGDDTQSSKGKSDASEEENKDDADKINIGQPSPKPQGWK